MNTRRIGAVPKSALWSGLKGGIFDAKHTKAMGSAIWLFGYLCMRQTQLNENGEGLPRYGNPTSTTDIARDTGWTRDQIDWWMRKLVRTGYIRTKRQGNDGVVIFIRNAKKKQRVKTGSVKFTEERPVTRSRIKRLHLRLLNIFLIPKNLLYYNTKAQRKTLRPLSLLSSKA